MRAKIVTTTNVTYWEAVLGSKEGVASTAVLVEGCVDEIPNFPLENPKQAYRAVHVQLYYTH